MTMTETPSRQPRLRLNERERRIHKEWCPCAYEQLEYRYIVGSRSSLLVLCPTCGQHFTFSYDGLNTVTMEATEPRPTRMAQERKSKREVPVEEIAEETGEY